MSTIKIYLQIKSHSIYILLKPSTKWNEIISKYNWNELELQLTLVYASVVETLKKFQ